MLKNEASRLASLATANPFTKEEWEKLKRCLEKNPKDFTLEEAEEFRELGRKATAEYWVRSEAYRLYMYAYIVYGLTLRRVYEEKEKKNSKNRQTGNKMQRPYHIVLSVFYSGKTLQLVLLKLSTLHHSSSEKGVVAKLVKKPYLKAVS
jgi:hypothetical protein